MTTTTLPRDALFRAQREGGRLELARAKKKCRDGCTCDCCDGGDMGDGEVMDGMTGEVMAGHFAVFNRWTEIDSLWEGNFMERIAPGAFRKTFRENRDGIRVLFQHGRDPQIGNKVLGPVDEIEEDDEGARYAVPLFDTMYNAELIPGLRAGQYGASFRFRVVREDLNMEPKPSEYNPRGIPERTVREASVSEFGPVTFPAYADATAGMRSITDDMILRTLTRNEPERFARLAAEIARTAPAVVLGERTTEQDGTTDHDSDAPADDAARSGTSEARREPTTVRPLIVTRNPNRSNRRMTA